MSVPGAGLAQATPCRECRTRDCCHDRDVPLLADEVVQLARTLAVAPERFARLVSAPATGGVALSALAGPRATMVLRRRPDGAGRTRCVFLMTLGSGRKVCGLGALAPAACKAFPAGERVAAGKVAGCWRDWQPGESEVPASPRARHEEAIARWNARIAERSHVVGEVAFLHALFADASLAGAAADADPTALPEPRSRSGCATCTTARCCVVFDPELTGADLARLTAQLGLAPHDVGELRPVRADQAGPDAVFLGDERAWELRLRRTGAAAGHQGPGGGRRCGFLVDLSHPEHAPASRCGVYAQRPMVCRLFPSDLTAFGVMVGNPETICPPQAWSQERADLATLHQLHLVARLERQRYRDFLVRWNEESRELAGLPHAAREAAFLAALMQAEV